MFTDDFIAYLLFQLILLMVNVIGLKRSVLLMIFALLGALILAVPTVLAFGDYYPMAVVLLLVNIGFPVFVLSHRRK